MPHKARILLIDVESVSNNVINIGLASIGAVLKARGHAVRVLDLNNITVPGRRAVRLRRALEWRPHVVGVSLFPACRYTYRQAERTLRRARALLGDGTLYVVGGVGVTVQPEAVAERFRGLADVLVRGEGEITFAELVERHLGGGAVEGLEGTVQYDGDRIVVNPPRPFIENLDDLPFPDYDLFDSVFEVRKEYPIMTSRGCPFDCIFCLNKVLSQRTFRPRSAENVVEEIRLAKEKYDFEALYIWDDHFSLRRGRAEEVCRMLIEERLDVKYYLPDGIRADSVTPEFARLLKESGCAGVSVGFEDANPETFPYIKKGERYEQIIHAIEVLKEAGVPVRASMVIGLPHTTYRSTLEGMERLKKLRIHAEWYLATPFPGTELYEWVEKHGRFLLDPLSLRALTFRYAVFETPEFTRAERYRAFYRGFAEYSFPEYAFYGKVCNPLTQQRSRVEKYLLSVFLVARYVPRRLPSHVAHLARDLWRALWVRTFGRLRRRTAT